MARVLFVDDDPLALTVLTKAAEIFGHQAFWACSGAEAVQTAIEQSPDIIFVDRRLNDMDGLVVISLLRENHITASTPLIMLSAGSELDTEEAALAAGARAFVQKPLQLQTLQNLIHQYTSEKPPTP